MNKSAVVAIGGNSISPEGKAGDIPQQFTNVYKTCEHLLPLLNEGYELVLTHGNGPQVGNALLRVELAASQIYPLPLDICVADTEGGMGYMIQQILRNVLTKANIEKPVVTLITQTIVNSDDPAFTNPTKPIGPFYSKETAEEHARLRGWQITEDAGRGYRRVVPSPHPKTIVEWPLVELLLKQGAVIIAVGGGGIPVVQKEDGFLKGVEAVVDKDLASALLASQIEAELFLISTGVEFVSINYRTSAQRNLREISLEEAKKYLKAGHFPPGSMGPKIQAAITFLENSKKRNPTHSPKVIITAPHTIADALAGTTGTCIKI